MSTRADLPGGTRPARSGRRLRVALTSLALGACALSVQALQLSDTAAPVPPAATRELAVCADPANLPFSNQRLEGFENRIADLLAAELKASVRYSWNMQRRSFLRRTLNAGTCDVVIGLPAGLQGVAQTRPYYRSSYVFVTRAGTQLQGLDDPQLRQLRIGLQAVGAEGANTPPAMALARRGIVERITGYPVWAEEADETPQARMLDAVARGEVDVAVVWGPIAGYFARPLAAQLSLSPLLSDPQQPALAFSYGMALSVRRADTALRDELQQVLDRRQPDIEAILRAYGVPLLPAASAAASPATSTAPATSSSSTSGLMAQHRGD